MRPKFDERDAEIRAERLQLFDSRVGPRVGDYIEFTDNVVRRISYIWDWDEENRNIQTTDGGSFYLGEGYCSFSGGMHPSIPESTLSLINEKREGHVWFFHRNFPMAHNGVDTTIPFRVFKCSLPANP